MKGSARPPKRHKGGQAGNLNRAARNPWNAFWKRRALRTADRWVLTLVRSYVPQLLEDKGGASEVSAAATRVMENAAVARACWALALSRQDFEATGRFLGLERAALVAVGLERRARPVASFAELVANAEAREVVERAALDVEAREQREQQPEAGGLGHGAEQQDLDHGDDDDGQDDDPEGGDDGEAA